MKRPPTAKTAKQITTTSPEAPTSKRAENVWFTAANEAVLGPQPLPPPTDPIVVRAPLRDQVDDRSSRTPSHGGAFALVSLLLVALAVGGTIVFLAVPGAQERAYESPPKPTPGVTPDEEIVGTTTTTGADFKVDPAQQQVLDREPVPMPPPSINIQPFEHPAVPVAAPPVTDELAPRPAAKPTMGNDGLPPEGRTDTMTTTPGLVPPTKTDPTTPSPASSTAPAETVDPTDDAPHMQLKR